MTATGRRIAPFETPVDAGAYVPRRETEQALRRLVDAVLDGDRPAALVGPPGLGKTLLLHRLAVRVAAALRPVLVADAARPAAAICAEVLARLGMPATGDPEAALLAHARRYADRDSALLILLDDAHRASPETARALARLCARSEGQLRLALAAREGDDTARRLGEFGGRTELVRLERPLSPRETRELVEARLARAGAGPLERSLFGPDRLDRIQRLSRGRPDRVLPLAEAVRCGREPEDALRPAPTPRPARPRRAPAAAPGPRRRRGRPRRTPVPPQRAPVRALRQGPRPVATPAPADRPAARDAAALAAAVLLLAAIPVLTIGDFSPPPRFGAPATGGDLFAEAEPFVPFVPPPLGRTPPFEPALSLRGETLAVAFHRAPALVRGMPSAGAPASPLAMGPARPPLTAERLRALEEEAFAEAAYRTPAVDLRADAVLASIPGIGAQAPVPDLPPPPPPFEPPPALFAADLGSPRPRPAPARITLRSFAAALPGIGARAPVPEPERPQLAALEPPPRVPPEELAARVRAASEAPQPDVVRVRTLAAAVPGLGAQAPVHPPPIRVAEAEAEPGRESAAGPSVPVAVLARRARASRPERAPGPGAREEAEARTAVLPEEPEAQGAAASGAETAEEGAPATPQQVAAAEPSAPRAAARRAPPHLAPGYVLVRVRADAPAAIAIDGRAYGETPLVDVPLLAGPHRFRARFPDGRRRERIVEVGEGRRVVAFRRGETGGVDIPARTRYPSSQVGP